MGVVYKAHDEKLDRIVALKVLPPDAVSHEDRRRRFLQEARAASALNHPHILTIYEIGEVDSQPYIAMEYIQGETLRLKIAARSFRSLLLWRSQYRSPKDLEKRTNMESCIATLSPRT